MTDWARSRSGPEKEDGYTTSATSDDRTRLCALLRSLILGDCASFQHPQTSSILPAIRTSLP